MRERLLEARPQFEGDGSGVKTQPAPHACGRQGRPAGVCRAGRPTEFRVGDAVMVREMPALFYTRTPEYVRGATGEIAEVAYESPAPEDEAFGPPDQTAGVVLHRSVQPLSALVWLHRHGQ